MVYFRAGYVPEHYPSELEWDARLLIEKSLAIKCPSIHYHLTGTKKVQQELARPGILTKYLTPEQVISVNEIFTGLYSLDKVCRNKHSSTVVFSMTPVLQNEAGDKAVQMALTNPTRFVLKPQREGGGNNVYGEDVKTVLKEIKDSNERSAYILMEMINPPLQHNYMIRPNLPEPLYTEVISELGIFGVIIGYVHSIWWFRTNQFAIMGV